MSERAGRLVVAATPIGDVSDASPRLAALIRTADVIAAEDTRRFLRLASALGVKPAGRVLSYHEHNEVRRGAELVEEVAGGSTVLLLTDAGMPSLSDPGLRAVRAVVDAGLPVTAVPGPSAVPVALALSGLATDRFCFEGFLPRAASARRRALSALSGEARTMVFFESRHRITGSLTAMADVFGVDRRAAVCRELTKVHEEVRRDTLGALAAWAAEAEPLGEITVVVAGAEPAADLDALVVQVRDRVAAGEKRSTVVAEVARSAGVRRGELYDAVLADPT